MLKKFSRWLFIKTHRTELVEVKKQIGLRLQHSNFIGQSAVGMIDALEMLNLY